jgi:hypothetical protein
VSPVVGNPAPAAPEPLVRPAGVWCDAAEGFRAEDGR